MKDQLKFITCGSVDDGKSTLIGHMLYDAKLLFTDQAKALELDSKIGSRGGEVDYSLLLDGLMAEREQGITIDVAYRYFTTEKRSFIVADCPGHEQYTRNMAVGASFADLAVLLVDATKGISRQTKRHARICSLMGIKHFVLAINKMDLVEYSGQIYRDIRREFKEYIVDFPVNSFNAIPVSATAGDNIVSESPNTGYYKGLPLLPYLENIGVKEKADDKGSILPVQRVSRPDRSFRGFEGQIEAGSLRVGDEIIALPNRETARIDKILVTDRYAETAQAGQAVTLTLDREIDISRGDLIIKGNGIENADMFACHLLWMDDQPLVPGRNYLLKCNTKLIPATVVGISKKIDIDTGNFSVGQQLRKNEIGICDISVSEKMPVVPFERNKALGGFILIDRVSNATAACGTILHPLKRSTNIVWQDSDISREMRSKQKNQQPVTLWFTGLSGSGKSALANALEKRLFSMDKHTMLFDGDNIRHGLNRDLGFGEADRVENIRRIAETARLMNDAGLIALTAFISPYAADRRTAKEIIGGNFVEIYVSTPLEVCEARDVKGLYKKARAGKIGNFTGINSPYEAPENPDITINTAECTIEEAVERIMEIIEKRIS